MKQLLLLAGNISPLLTALVSAPIMARLLGPDGRGEVSVALLLCALVQVVGAWGVPWSARRDFAELGPGSLRTWVRRALFAALAASPLASAAWLWMAANYDLSKTDEVGVAIVLLLSVLSALRGIYGNLLIARGVGWLYGLHLLATSVVNLVVLVTFAVMGVLSVATTLVANSISLGFAVVFLNIVVRRMTTTRESNRAPSPLIWRNASAVWTTQVTEFCISRADIILVVVLGAATQVGVYSIASIISVAAYALSTTVVQLSYAPARYRFGRRRIPIMVQVCAILGITIAALSIPAIELVFPLVFGPAFASVQDFGVAVAVMTVAVTLIAPVIGMGADGSRWTYILAACTVAAFIMAFLADVLTSSLPAAVTVMGSGLLLGAAFILIRSSRGEVFRIYPSEIRAWLRGRDV